MNRSGASLTYKCIEFIIHECGVNTWMKGVTRVSYRNAFSYIYFHSLFIAHYLHPYVYEKASAVLFFHVVIMSFMFFFYIKMESLYVNPYISSCLRQ